MGMYTRLCAGLVIATLLAASTVSPGGVMQAGQAKGDDVCPEPNDDFQAACYLGPGADALGFISRADDLDAYRFEAFDFNVKAHVEIADEPVPYQFVVANWNGDPIATSTTNGSTEIADLILPLPGSYYVFVQSRTGEFTDTTPYRILTRLDYATQPPPRATYRGDFRAGSGDSEEDKGTVDYVRAGGKVTIVSKAAGTRAQSNGGGTYWLGSNTDHFVLTVDSRVVSGNAAGYGVQFGALEPIGGPLHDQFYLTVDPPQQRAVLGQFVGTAAKVLVPWTPAPSLSRDGKVNRTVLEVTPGRLRVTINGSEVFTWNGDIPAGRFAIDSLNWGEGTSVSFDNVLLTVPDAKPAPGTVLMSENFDDQSKGLLSVVSGTPDIFSRAYEGGEYVLRLRPGDVRRAASSPLPFQYDDSTLAVDGRITESSPNNYLYLQCRSTMVSPDVYHSYGAVVYPATGRVGLRRTDGAQTAILGTDQTSPAVKKGTDMNHVEMTCRGSTISISVNGTPVVSVEDATYQRGDLWIGVGSSQGGPPSVEVHYDNLVVTKQ